MQEFDIPIVLFIFKRAEKAAQIIDRISMISPQKLYLIGDGPRSEEEVEEVEKCRRIVEKQITWKCDVICNYSKDNRGVYLNIAGGAKWVFEREECAIFLEDDNMPELSFFSFCKEMLSMYKLDTRILWICGTNYLKKFEFPNNVSYYFTQHMMPCGWASWANKFIKFYDGDLCLFETEVGRSHINNLSYDKLLKKQDISNWEMELRRKHNELKFLSWDYQMSFSLRIHGLYGIVPKYNQITNIGVDIYSIHGGVSYENEMTRRFCGLPTYSIEFPLKHPLFVATDPVFENKTAKIITLPFFMRFKAKISSVLKYLFGVEPEKSFTDYIKWTIFKKQ